MGLDFPDLRLGTGDWGKAKTITMLQEGTTGEGK